jgi:ribosomal protein L40E
MARFPEAEARLFRNKFVCRRCNAVVRVPSRNIAEGKVVCRKCDYKRFKPKRKK